MTSKEAKKIIYNQWQAFLDDNIDYAGVSEAYKMALKALEQQELSDKNISDTHDVANEEAIEQLNVMKVFIGYDAENPLVKRMQSALDCAIKALEQQPSRCSSCTHSEEQDGSNCYECVKGITDNFELMRDATEEERKSVKDHVESISTSTGVRFDTQPTDAKETIIKSALKYLVKMQIKQGSVGFAVDDDHDHDCCWDDVLAWLEAQPCEDAVSRQAVETFKEELIDKLAYTGYTEEYKDEIIDIINQMPPVTPSYNSIKTELKPCEDCISRQAGIEGLTELINNLKGVQGDMGSAVNSARELIKTLPPVTPTSEDIKEAYLKGYDYGVKDWFRSKTQPCEDVVSRQAVLDTIGNVPDHNDGMVFEALSHAQRDVALLPPVKPKYTDEEIDKAQAVEQAYVDKMVELAVEERKRPNGRWIKCKSRFGVEYFKCSECGRRLDWIDRDDNYCNNCGSDNSESTKELYKEWDTKLAEISGGEE